MSHTTPTINHPIFPNQILELIKVSSIAQGHIIPTSESLTVQVPSFTTSTFELAVPSGFVALITEQHELDASFFEALIDIDFNIDDDPSKLDIEDLDLTTTQELKVSFFVPSSIKFKWTIDNQSAETTNFFIKLQMVKLESTFFETFYQPLIDNSFRVLETSVLERRGRF